MGSCQSTRKIRNLINELETAIQPNFGRESESFVVEANKFNRLISDIHEELDNLEALRDCE